MGTKILLGVMMSTLLTMALLPLTLDLHVLGAQPDDRLAAPAAFPVHTPDGQSDNSVALSEGQAARRTLQSSGLRRAALARSLLAGLSTSLGAGVVLVPRSAPTPTHMAFALSLAGGVMVTVSVVELWWPKILDPDWRLHAVFFACTGAMAFVALSWLVPEPEYAEEADDAEIGAKDNAEKQQPRKGKQWRLAILMMLALTAHNFPEGMAVAISSMESERLGFVVMAAIAVHNVPEGIAIAMPVFDATKSRLRALQLATLSGLAEPLGAFFSLTMLPEELLHGRGMDALLCVVGGIMSCVAIVELFPEARNQNQHWASLGGTVTGALIMLLTHEYA